MKDPAVGAFGVLWLVLVPLLQVAAVSACVLLGSGTASLLLAVTTGRLAICAACRKTPAATTSGLGALVAESVRGWVVWAWLIVLSAAFAAYALVDPDTLGQAWFRVLRTALAAPAALLVTAAIRKHAVRRVGGLTGDVLGALCELATTVCLLVLTIPGPHPLLHHVLRPRRF